jgi:hypothetical protein
MEHSGFLSATGDDNTPGETMSTIKKTTEGLLHASSEIGLKNAKKDEYLFTSLHHNVGKNNNLIFLPNCPTET